MLEAYRHHAAERAALGIPPLPLTPQQTADLIELLKNPPAGEDAFLLDLLVNRVPAGVDDAAKVKASYLAALAFGSVVAVGFQHGGFLACGAWMRAVSRGERSTSSP
jgi:aconitate hydratase 2/2-methylisocitrate dehydratase